MNSKQNKIGIPAQAKTRKLPITSQFLVRSVARSTIKQQPSTAPTTMVMPSRTAQKGMSA
jgi:hypothetical protein